MPSLTLSWRTHSIDKLGISIDVVADNPVQEGQAGELYYVQQQKPVTLNVWSGKDTTLSWWLGRFGGKQATIGTETAITICGRPGKRQEVSAPADRATGAFRGSDGSIGHIKHEVPALVHVAISGATAAGVPFVASWVVDADRRQTLHADEDHFLASIRC